jgi:hypothetical protein
MWMDTREAEPVENWQKMLAALRKEFRDNSPLMDLAKKAEEENVFNRVESKVAMHTLRREASKADNTKGAASGIAPDINRLAESFRRQAQLLVDSNDLEGVRNVYRRAFSDHGDDPALFKALGKDFFGFVKKDPEVASKACKDIEGACRRYVGKGGGDWFDTKSQNSAWEVVAKCYRETGDTKKADGIAKDIQQREEAAKRKAI